MIQRGDQHLRSVLAVLAVVVISAFPIAACSIGASADGRPSTNEFPVDQLTADFLEHQVTLLDQEDLTAEIYYLPPWEGGFLETPQSPYVVRSGTRIAVTDPRKVRELQEATKSIEVVDAKNGWAEFRFEVVFKLRGREIFDEIFSQPDLSSIYHRSVAVMVVGNRIGTVTGEGPTKICQFVKQAIPRKQDSLNC